MTCPLGAILNPRPSSSPNSEDGHDRDSTNDSVMDGNAVSKSTKSLRSSSDTGNGPSKTATRVALPAIVLSPQKSRLYGRRASTSPTHLPVLTTPRKRDPSAHVADHAPSWLETNVESFSVFNALLDYPELTLEFSKHLDIDDLISLYAISKEYHRLVNARFTALILGQSVGKASESSSTFIHRCYKTLCMRDPARRINETRPDQIRFVPSFRWLRMVLFREKVVDDILETLAVEGHRLPKRTSLVLKKLWFTLDVCDNFRRIGLVHNERFWANKDLFVATMFFIKLDLRLTDPMTGNGEIGLRRMLLNQRSFSTLAKVLKREEMRTQTDMLRMIVRWNYLPSRRPTRPILGVVPREIGKLQYEGWGSQRTRFIPVDELVAREAIRRRLNLQNHYVDMMIYGFMNKHTFEDIRTPMPPLPPREKGTEEADESESEGEDEQQKARKCSGRQRFMSESSEEQTRDEDGAQSTEDMDFEAYNLDSASKDEGFDPRNM